MTRTRFLLLSIGLCALSVESFSQYVISYPYLDPYSYNTPTISSVYFQLPRPGDTYRSVRVRSLAEGFSGLISDPYTDHFRNPGIHPVSTPVEVFGDLGSASEQGKFLFGTFVETPRGTFAADVRLERLQKFSTSSNSTQLSSSSSPSTYSYENSSDYSPEKAGGRLAYTWALPDEHTFGVSYEYLHDRYQNTSSSSSTNSYPGYTSNSMRTEDYSQTGEIHVVGFGAVTQKEKGSVEFRGRGVFSSYKLANSYDNRQTSGNYHSYSITNYPTDVTTKGFLAGVVFAHTMEDGGRLRLVIDGAYTQYTASGTVAYRSESGDSISASGYVQEGQRSSDGSIVDLLVGVGYEKRLLDDITGYAGISGNYVLNNVDHSELRTERQFGPGGPFPPPVTTTTTSEIDLDGFDVRLPMGVEYLPFEFLTLRGGVEARYRSGERSTSQTLSMTFTPPISGQTSNNLTQRGLMFAASFGIAAHHQDYGEAGILFGKNLSDTNLWSFFLRYFV